MSYEEERLTSELIKHKFTDDEIAKIKLWICEISDVSNIKIEKAQSLFCNELSSGITPEIGIYHILKTKDNLTQYLKWMVVSHIRTIRKCKSKEYDRKDKWDGDKSLAFMKYREMLGAILDSSDEI